jgi:endonuclease/exonuclease/phosphatase family metal-dependent hydrolase
MTWNLLRPEWARPAWPPWEDRVDQVTETIRERMPDLLAVQEETPRMVEDLLMRLEGYRYWTAPPEPQSASGLLVRKDRVAVLSRTRVDLPFDRAVTVLQVDVEGTVFRVGSTHFTPFEERLTARTASAELLAAWAEAVPSPLVVMGDFNSLPGDPALSVLAGAGFRDAFSPLDDVPVDMTTAVETPADTRGIRLDYILLRGQWTVKQALIPSAHPGASDHKPLLADLTLSP